MESNRPLDSDMSADLHLTGESRSNLDQTAGWAKFLAIIGFVFIGLMVLGALSIGFWMDSFIGEEIPGGTLWLTILYLAIAALYFFPILYLYQFATNMKDAIRSSDQRQMDIAFSNIKAHYRFVGILAIVILGFYALALVIVIIGGLAAGF